MYNYLMCFYVGSKMWSAGNFVCDACWLLKQCYCAVKPGFYVSEGTI